MDSANPYVAPEANLAEQAIESYQPKVFSFNGRIGRVRCLVYGILGNLALMSVMFLLAVVVVALFVGNNPSGAEVLTIGVTVYLPIYIFTYALMKRRLNDLDRTGWLALLSLIPLLNFIFGLYLLFAKGTQGANRFGPPAIKVSAPMYFVMVLSAIVAMAIMVIAILSGYLYIMKE